MSPSATSLILDINPLLLIDDPADCPFVRVGKPALRRGFAITPITPNDPNETEKTEKKKPKTPTMERWNTRPIRTYTDLLQRAYDHANDNVGVVMRHPRYGDCWHFVFDIDGDDVLNRIYRDTGKHLLDEIQTLIVQSQPEKKPWKMHIYLAATEYSAFLLTKEVTDPKDYDLKGTGAGGQVLAAGSTHFSGSTYTYMTDLPIAPIPDWLVDWLLVDIRRQRSEAAKIRYATKIAKKAAPKVSSPTTTGVTTMDAAPVKDATGEAIFRLMQSRAGSFASYGVSRALIETVLIEQVATKYGKECSKTARTKELAHQLAYSSTLRIGTIPDFFGVGRVPFILGGKQVSQHAADPRSTRLVKLLQTFPDKLTTEDAEARVREVWPDYDGKDGAHKTALCRARQKAGFIAKDGFWTRTTPLVAVL